MTQPWQFEEPTQGDRFTAEEAQNRRLIVVPIEYVPEIRTQRGDTVDGIRINVVDLDHDGGPQTYWGALWFGARLIQNFKPKIGKMFLGYVSKQRTSGGFQAWVFTSLTSDQQTAGMAQQHLQAHPEFMETSMGDVRVAETSAQQPRQAVQGWNQSQQTPFPPGQAQQWGPQQHGPVPPQVQQQGPAPLPPQTQADPWPELPQGNGEAPTGPTSAPPATPTSPGPAGESVMERLRRQRAEQGQGQQQAPAQGQIPF